MFFKITGKSIVCLDLVRTECTLHVSYDCISHFIFSVMTLVPSKCNTIGAHKMFSVLVSLDAALK